MSAAGAGVQRQDLRGFRILLRGTVIALAVIQSWAARHASNPDALSYLDIAAAYADGRWSDALNAYWSPVYSWMIASMMALSDPASRWELPLVHLLNFAVFLAGLAAFEFMLRGVVHRPPVADVASPEERASDGEADRLTLLLAYTLFAWGMLHLIGLAVVSPDLLLATLLFICFGLLARVALPAHRNRTATLLGLALGAGCLTKSAMFPLSLVFLAASGYRLRHARVTYRPLLIATGALILTVGPWVYALSARVGHLTFGAASRLNYDWFVNGHGRLDGRGGFSLGHWRDTAEAAAGLVHPPRRIVSHPATFEFATPLGGSYPVWTDPAYWNEGARVRFDLGNQVRATAKNLAAAIRVFLPLILAILALTIVAGARPAAAALSEQLWLLLPAGAGLAMYLLVLFASRYMGAFASVIGVVAVVALVRAARLRRADAPARAVVVILILTVWATMLPQRYEEAHHAWRSLSGAATANAAPWQIASAMNDAGVEPGSHVGVIGSAQVYLWPRLAGVRIVAEVQDRDVACYWAGDPAVRARVHAALVARGIRTLIAEHVPATAGDEWVRIHPGPHSIRRLTGSSDDFARGGELPRSTGTGGTSPGARENGPWERECREPKTTGPAAVQKHP